MAPLISVPSPGGNQVSDEGREVFLPVNKDVEELVESREDRR